MKKLVTLIAVLAMVGSAMATPSSDDFSSYTAGAWNTTEMAAKGWAYYDAATAGITAGTAYGRSGVGTRYDSSPSGDTLPVWGRTSNGGRVDSTDGLLSYWINVQTNTNFVKLGNWNEGNGTVTAITLDSSNDILFETTTGTVDIGDWVADTWVNILIDFDLDNDRSRAKVGGGSWSAYSDFLGSRTATYVQTYSMGRNSDYYMDDFSITPEPATIALLGFGGLALLRRKRA